MAQSDLNKEGVDIKANIRLPVKPELKKVDFLKRKPRLVTRKPQN